jgi:ABC-type phosphate/phosphonate transport system substrate-binding protein
VEDLEGVQLGQYRIVSRLGEGGMATVFRAYQPRMDRYVALKVLPRHYATDPTFVGRFEQEARVIANLEHPNILPVHDYGESDGYTYLVMRYVSGGTLADVLAGGALGFARVYQIVCQVAAALDYAHSRGVIHRDIKPSNVLIDDHGNCFLTDFGIAKMLEAATRLTVTGGFVGTPTYASPEQCLGRDLDGRSDVYSLGVMLYEMSTGRLPFDADTPMAVAIKQIHDPLPLPSTVSPRVSESVERVILKALAKDPRDRYATAGELVRALEQALPREPAPVARARPRSGLAVPGRPAGAAVRDLQPVDADAQPEPGVALRPRSAEGHVALQPAPRTTDAVEAAGPKLAAGVTPTPGTRPPVAGTVPYGAPPSEPAGAPAEAPPAVDAGASLGLGSALPPDPAAQSAPARAAVSVDGVPPQVGPAVVESRPAETPRPDGRHRRRGNVPTWTWVLLGVAIVALIAVAVVGVPRLLVALQPPPPTPLPRPTERIPATERPPTVPPSDEPQPEVAAALGTHERPLVLASIPLSNRPESPPAIEHVAVMVSELSGLVVAPAIVPDLVTARQLLENGEAHAAWLDAMEYVAASERAVALVAIVSVRFGSTWTAGQFVTRADSGIHELPQLRGRVVCFGPRNSLTGSILPRLTLRAAGIDPGPHLAEDPELENHRQVILGVYQGECEAGASFADARGTVEDEFPDVWEKVVVLDTTVEVPHYSLSFVEAVPPDVREQVVDAFFRLLEVDEGREALNAGYWFEGLEPIGDEAFEPLRELLAATGLWPHEVER